MREQIIRMLQPEPWRKDAVCSTLPLSVFYPSPKAPESAYNEARSHCNVCPVRVECGQAGALELYGMWGGLTPRERAGNHVSRICGRGIRSVDGHGTEAGYKKHRADGETPCDECWGAARVKWAERHERRRMRGAA